MLVKKVHQFTGIVGRKMPAMVVLDASVGQADDVASCGHVVGAHLIADGRRFERSAPLIHLVQVVAHDGSVGHLASRREAFRYGDKAPVAPLPCQQVHVWCVGVLQWSFPAKTLDAVVGHAVAEDDDMLHDEEIKCWRYS